MSQHRLRPSSAGRWVNCPGSVAMEADPSALPDNEENGAEGTASHYVGAVALRGAPIPCVGMHADNGVLLNEMMIKCALAYVEAVRESAAGSPVAVEQQLDCAPLHPACGGTPDAWYYDANTGTVHVDDLKYGWGIVEAEENWQLICYAAGVLSRLAAGWKAPFETVAGGMGLVLRIIQPRPPHVLGSVREWRLAPGAILPYIERLAAAAQEAMNPGASCRTGHHCLHCHGRHACVAAQRSGYLSVEYTYRSTPELLSPAALSVEYTTLLRAQEAIKLRITGLEAQAFGLIDRGTHVPGYTVEAGKGRRKWDVPTPEVFAIGDLLGYDLRAEAEAITPTQARDKKFPGEVINKFSSIGSTDKKLVQSTSTLAARVFGQKGIF